MPFSGVGAMDVLKSHVWYHDADIFVCLFFFLFCIGCACGVENF